MKAKTITLDVREDIRNGREPFGRIMQTVAALKEQDQLRLIAPFEPAPLYAVLAQRGYTHQTTPTPDGSFEVLFTRDSDEAEMPKAKAASAGATRASDVRVCAGTPVVEVDARGQEPPQPLVTILEALEKLPQGACLRARTDRRPMHLYAQLEERGFVAESEEQANGSFVTHVRRR